MGADGTPSWDLAPPPDRPPTIPDFGNPQAFNRYSYAFNNPVNLIDPSGFSPEGGPTLSDLFVVAVNVASLLDALLGGGGEFLESVLAPNRVAGGPPGIGGVHGIAPKDDASVLGTIVGGVIEATGFPDVLDDVGTVFNPEASTEDRVWAAIRLGWEFTPYGKLARLGRVVGRGANRVGKAIAGKGPHSNLPDHPSVGSGKDFTRSQKRKILEQNEARNKGVLRDERTGEELVRPQQSRRGVRPPDNEANVDHFEPKALGGTNSFGNAEVRSRANSLKKGARPPEEP